MEALGDAIVFPEAPHTDDGVFPLFDGSGEYLQWCERGALAPLQSVQQLVDVLFALPFGSAFSVHEFS